MKFPIALQMYTVRNEQEKDYLGAFQKVADIGYQGVEMEIPPESFPIRQVRNHLDQLSLKWIGCHVDHDQITSQPDKLLNALNQAGCGNLVLSYLEYHSLEEVNEAARLFNQFGKACWSQGIQFSYHNHNHEFQQFGGRRVLDILIESTDPELVKFEMDTYWVQRAGVDPAEYLLGLRGRCPLLHIKDMEAGPEQFFAEIGEGILDFTAIFRAAESVGVQWLIVEQDECRRSAFESIAMSYNNLTRMIEL